MLGADQREGGPVHRVGDPGDVPARGPTRGDQPRPGFPDFPCPPELKAAACAAIEADDNQYPMTFGNAALRAAIAAKTARTYPGWAVDPDTEVCVTCGATEALVAVTFALLDPGDEIVLFEPWYENYRPNAILSGAVRAAGAAAASRTGRSTRPSCGRPSARARRRCSSATRTTRPARSTGPTSWPCSPSCAGAGTPCSWWTRSTSTSTRLGPGGYLPPALVPGLETVQLTVNALSKTYAVTGWRVGWTLAPRGDHRRDPQGARLPDDRRPGAPSRRRASRRLACPRATTTGWPPCTASAATCCAVRWRSSGSTSAARTARTTC